MFNQSNEESLPKISLYDMVKQAAAHLNGHARTSEHSSRIELRTSDHMVDTYISFIESNITEVNLDIHASMFYRNLNSTLCEIRFIDIDTLYVCFQPSGLVSFVQSTNDRYSVLNVNTTGIISSITGAEKRVCDQEKPSHRAEPTGQDRRSFYLVRTRRGATDEG